MNPSGKSNLDDMKAGGRLKAGSFRLDCAQWELRIPSVPKGMMLIFRHGEGAFVREPWPMPGAVWFVEMPEKEERVSSRSHRALPHALNERSPTRPNGRVLKRRRLTRFFLGLELW